MLQVATYAQLETKGPSWTHVIRGGKVLIRQGAALMQLDFATQKLEKKVEMPPYERNPIAITGTQYIEVYSDHVLTLEIGQYQVQRQKLPMRFPDDLLNPSFIQFDKALVIQNTSQLFVLYFADLKIKLLSPVESPISIENCMILLPTTTRLYFVLDGEFYRYDTAEFRFCNDRLPFKGLGCHGLMLSPEQFLAVQEKSIVSFSFKTQKETVLYQSDASLKNCALTAAGSYLLVTDQAGKFLVFQTKLAQEAVKARVDFEIMKLLQKAKDVQEKAEKDRRKKDTLQDQDVLGGSKIFSLHLTTKGDSFTGVADPAWVVVRQGVEIQKVNLTTKQVEKSLTLKGTYTQNTVVALYDRVYYELLTNDTVLIVDCETMQPREEKLIQPFLEPLDSPAFMQFNDVLLVHNVFKLYVFNLNTLKAEKINRAPLGYRISGGLMLMPTKNIVWVVGNGEAVVYDTYEHSDSKIAFKLSPQGADGFMVDYQSMVVAEKKRFVLYRLDGTQKTLWEHEGIHGCKMALSDTFILITTQDGELCVFQTYLAQKAIAFRPILSIRTDQQ